MNKTVLITGSDGFLGGKIVKRIMSESDWNVLGLTLDLDMPKAMLEREGIEDNSRVRFMTNDVFLDPNTEINDMFILLFQDAFSLLKILLQVLILLPKFFTGSMTSMQTA